MYDELRSAYAALGLQPWTPLPKVKRQFKTLVRRWHPDRFASDSQGRIEANDRLRVINKAYNTIVRSTGHQPVVSPTAAPSAAAPEPPPPRTRPVPRPLTREQIDAMIAALTRHRRRRPLRDQLWDDPLNRGGSVLVAAMYLIGRIWIVWRSPRPQLTLAGVRPTLPAGPVLAATAETLVWMFPLLLVIWYGSRSSRVAAWCCLLLFALVLPLI